MVAEEKIEERQSNPNRQLQKIVYHTLVGVSGRAPIEIIRGGREWGGGRSDVGGGFFFFFGKWFSVEGKFATKRGMWE